jgi:hypothetical protein
MMNSILQGRPTFEYGGLEIMDTLDRLLTFPSNVNMLTDPNYQHHLAVTG